MKRKRNTERTIPMVDQLAVGMTDSTRHCQQVGAAASFGAAAYHAMKYRKVKTATAKFYAKQLAWRKLTGRDVFSGREAEYVEPEGRQLDAVAIAPRGHSCTVDEARAELQSIIQDTIAERKVSYSWKTEWIEGQLKSSRVAVERPAPKTLAEFCERFPNKIEAVMRLVAIINPKTGTRT